MMQFIREGGSQQSHIGVTPVHMDDGRIIVHMGDGRWTQEKVDGRWTMNMDDGHNKVVNSFCANVLL